MLAEPSTQARRYIASATEEAIPGKSATKAALDRATGDITLARDPARPILADRRAR